MNKSTPSFSIARTALRRPVTVIVAVIALMLAAWVAARRVPKDVFPTLGIPTIYVAQPYGGMDPLQMEGYLTYYYEYHFLYITGIEHVESKSIQGASIMKLQFHPGTDMSNAMAETVAYVNRARAFMPPGTPGPFVTRFDAGSVPVGNLVFSTDNPSRTVGQMQDAALNMVRPLFATLPGVSAPPPFGGSARTILVSLKPERIKAYGISPDEVVSAMTAANTVSPSGNLISGQSFAMVPTNAVAKNIQELATVPLRTSSEGVVLLRDVAEVSDGSDLVTSVALVNGRRTVYMPVTKRSDASTLTVVSLVKANLKRFKEACPEDIQVSFEFDQSPWIERAIGELVKEALLGALLTGVMVLLFLRDLRGALAVVVNIPVSLGAALCGLWVSGHTINLMTLGGLALAVGILVDEATVEIENLHRQRALGHSVARAALISTSQTQGARFLSMLCVVAVFLPAFFMEGSAKALFLPLALAVAFSMVASYVLSSTLLPVLSVWMGAGGGVKHNESVGDGMFVRLARLLIRARWVAVPVYVALAVLMVRAGVTGMGREIFPAVDAGQIQLRFRAEPGTRVDVTEQIAQKILGMVAEEAGPGGVAMTMGLVGVHAPNYPVNLIHQWNSGPEEGTLQIQLAGSAGPVSALRERLRRRFAGELPGVRVSFEPADIVSKVMALGATTPIEVVVSGKDLGLSRAFAERVRGAMAELPMLRDVQVAQSLDYPSVEVNVDRERAGLMGVRMADATRSLVAATASSRFTVPNYWADAKTGVSYSLQVQVPPGSLEGKDALLNLPVTGVGGRAVPLRSFAQVSDGTVVGQYDRYNMARVVSVGANVEGADLGAATDAVEKALGALERPAGVQVAVRGQSVPLLGLTEGLVKGLGAAVLVVLLLLAANFQSFRHAVVVLGCIPATLAGVVWGLRLAGDTLNLQSFIGAIMAVGVSVSNAILFVTFAVRAQRERRVGATEAALEGLRGRVRPVLMTAFAMLAGMVPMAVGGGTSGPLARAVMGGVVFSTVATLFLIPGLYALLGGAGAHEASLDPDDEGSRLYEQV
jgi:multidrug efflux pump subunit AcrB